MPNKLIASVVLGRVADLTPSAASLLGTLLGDDNVAEQVSQAVPTTEEALIEFVRSLYRCAKEMGLTEGVDGVAGDGAYIAGVMSTN